MRLRTCLLLLQAALLAGSCPDIEMHQTRTLHSFKPGSPTTINCQHSCNPRDAINQFHPTVTIQTPNDYTPHDLHSRRLVDTFLSIYNLSSQISLRYFKTETCGSDSLRRFGLEISNINTNRLNNSVIHCGVMSDECLYYGEGIIFLRMPMPPTSRSGDIKVYQTATLHSLEHGSPTTINCQHSCGPRDAINLFHPTLTIQIPNDYTPHDLHSRPLVDTFLSIYNLTGQISLRYFKNDSCGRDSLRHFGLEISDINTTRLNNSMIQCGVTTSEDTYNGKGMIFLWMPNSSSQPSTVVCGTSYILYHFLYHFLYRYLS